MSETRLFVGLIWAVLTWSVWVLLYRLGGWKNKVWRRWVGGGLLATSLMGLALFTHHFTWWMLAGLVTYPAWLTFGYGGDTTATKATRRVLYGLAGGLAATPFLLPSLWGLLVVNVVMSVALSLYLGLKNPLSAVGEEGALGGVYAVLVVFSPLR